MHSYMLASALIGVTENFTEGDQDGSWRDLRALCGTEPDLCDATGSDGKRFCPSQLGCDVPFCGCGTVRTRAVVFHAGGCDQPGGVPDHAVDSCRLCPVARPHPGV